VRAQCPVSTYEQVCDIFLEDFGALPETVFRRFSPTPLASASLAQVHEAELHSGERVACKVQHHGLRECATADVLMIG